MSVYTWEVLSIPPMSHSKISVNNEGALGLDFTAIYKVVTVGECSHPKKNVIHNGEEGINCTVAKHSIG